MLEFQCQDSSENAIELEQREEICASLGKINENVPTTRREKKKIRKKIISQLKSAMRLQCVDALKWKKSRNFFRLQIRCVKAEGKVLKMWKVTIRVKIWFYLSPSMSNQFSTTLMHLERDGKSSQLLFSFLANFLNDLSWFGRGSRLIEGTGQKKRERWWRGNYDNSDIDPEPIL